MKFDSSKVKELKLKVIDFRVPKRNELYLDKNGKVQRLHEDRQQSKRARHTCILLEDFPVYHFTTI